MDESRGRRVVPLTFQAGVVTSWLDDGSQRHNKRPAINPVFNELLRTQTDRQTDRQTDGWMDRETLPHTLLLQDSDFKGDK